MEVREINNKDIWEGFLLENKEKTFLDSWNWGEFQKSIEEKIWRLGVYDKELKAVALVVKVKAKRGTFLFIPHGPIGEKNILPVLIEELKKIAKKEKACFIRIASLWTDARPFKDLGFKHAPIHMHPELTWELDITPEEEEILMGMRKTTRYLIRQGEKDKNIEIIKSSNINDLEKFNCLYEKTALRHHFFPFSLDYLKKQFSCFNQDNQILIFLGKYKGEIISSAIMVFWQNTGFYHHGASLTSKAPVSYLMQWEAIKEAKNRGCRKYNFWGIAPEGRKNHPWAGLSLFKKGFGGYAKQYIRTQDLPLSMRYWFTNLFERFRRIKRGL